MEGIGGFLSTMSIFAMIFGLWMVIAGRDDYNSPLTPYGIMIYLCSFVYFLVYLITPDTIENIIKNLPKDAPKWEDVKGWYIARYRGW